MGALQMYIDDDDDLEKTTVCIFIWNWVHLRLCEFKPIRIKGPMAKLDRPNNV